MIDAAGERLDVFEALLAEPHRHVERTCTVMADDDDGGVRVEFLVCSGGNVAHRDKRGSREGCGAGFPWFADIKNDRLFRLLQMCGESID